MGRVGGRLISCQNRHVLGWVESACSAISDYWVFYSAIYTLVHSIRIYLRIEEPQNRQVYCNR